MPHASQPELPLFQFLDCKSWGDDVQFFLAENRTPASVWKVGRIILHKRELSCGWIRTRAPLSTTGVRATRVAAWPAAWLRGAVHDFSARGCSGWHQHRQSSSINLPLSAQGCSAARWRGPLGLAASRGGSSGSTTAPPTANERWRWAFSTRHPPSWRTLPPQRWLSSARPWM